MSRRWATARLAAGIFLAPIAAHSQELALPDGLTVANQIEYAWNKNTEQPQLENWTDAQYASSAFSAGFRFGAFQPPDPTVSSDRSNFSLNYRFIEAASDHGTLRVGNYYALFGHGLMLNAYEKRDLRVDSNLEGVRLQGARGPFTLQLVTGTTASGSSEDSERPRLDRVHGADLALDRGFGEVTTGVGASAVRLQTDGGASNEMLGVRGNVGYGPLHLEVEHVGYGKPGGDGEGFFASGSMGVGPLQLLGEYKDYDKIALRASDGSVYNLPPALIREQTYTLLNRHPHTLDPDDEKGFQFEGVYALGKHSLTGHYAKTRNHRGRQVFNYFDEIYGEAFLSLGHPFGSRQLDVILAADHQKSFEGLVPSQLTGELTVPVFRRLFTDVVEVRLIATEIHSYRVQFEHQHNDGKLDGKFDTWLGLLEWSRSPDLTVNLVGEVSNRSEVQLADGEKKDALYGIVSYHLSDRHDVSLLYGRRLAGFICVGGVCRFEPEFEGLEMRLLSRF